MLRKRVVDFLLVLIELFATCYGWGATISVQNRRFRSDGWPKISGRRGRYNQPFFFLEK